MNFEEAIAELESNKKKMRFSRMSSICSNFFGKPRAHGTSHHVFKMPWPGDPRINIQNVKGKVPVYQVEQAIEALRKLQELKKT